MTSVFESNDLIELGLKADELRRKIHPEGIVSYCIDAAAVSPVQLNAEDPLEHRLKQLDQYCGARAVMPCFKQDVSAVEYLKILALTRLHLENVAHIQTSWTTGGLKLCQIALRCLRCPHPADAGSLAERDGEPRPTPRGPVQSRWDRRRASPSHHRPHSFRWSASSSPHANRRSARRADRRREPSRS